MPYYNLINHELSLMVCFSPKCGCTTLKDWFLHSFSPDKISKEHTVESYMIPNFRISEYREFTKILVLRDPFRRLVSYFCRFVVKGNNDWCFADNDKNYFLRGKSFLEFVEILEDIARKNIEFQHHVRSQTEGVRNVKFDAVFALEHLGEHLSEFNKNFGINYNIPTLNANQYDETSRNHVYNTPADRLANLPIPKEIYFYNLDLIAKVEKLYREDLSFYRAYYDNSLLFPAQYPLYARWRARIGLARAWKCWT